MYIPSVGATGLAGFEILKTTDEQQKAAVRADATTARDIEYFKENIGTVLSAEDLIGDYRLLDVALTAYGLESEIDNRAFVQEVLESDLSDSSSFANRLNDQRWLNFASGFGFGDPTAGQTVPALQAAVELRVAAREGAGDKAGLDITTGQLEIFRANADSIATVDDLLGNEAVLQTVLAAYRLDENPYTTDYLRSVLESDPADETSLINTIEDGALRAMANAFNLGVPSEGEQSALSLNVERAVAQEGLRADFASFDISDEDLETFREEIYDIKSADDFLANDTVKSVALTVFGLENEAPSDAFLREVLTGDVTDPDSFIGSLSDNNPWRQLNIAFTGVKSDGGQSTDYIQYEVEQRLIERGASDADMAYLRKNFDLVDENINLTIDPRLQDIVLSAFDLPKNTYTGDFVLSVMISDPNSDTSFVNVINDDRWFDFNTVFGSFTKSNAGVERFQDEVVDLFVDRTYQIGVGEVDENIRLALNFEASIDTIANSSSVATAGWYTLLGDSALREVVDTTFGLPDEFAQIDIESQDAILRERSLSLFGGTDPSVFQSQENIDTLIQRFFLQKQIEESATSTTSAALTLLQNSATFAQTINQTV